MTIHFFLCLKISPLPGVILHDYCVFIASDSRSKFLDDKGKLLPSEAAAWTIKFTRSSLSSSCPFAPLQGADVRSVATLRVIKFFHRMVFAELQPRSKCRVASFDLRILAARAQREMLIVSSARRARDNIISAKFRQSLIDLSRSSCFGYLRACERTARGTWHFGASPISRAVRLLLLNDVFYVLMHSIILKSNLHAHSICKIASCFTCYECWSISSKGYRGLKTTLSEGKKDSSRNWPDNSSSCIFEVSVSSSEHTCTA